MTSISIKINVIGYRRGYKPESQEEIGWELGLVVPEEDERFFQKVRVGKKPKAGYGTQASFNKNVKYSLNRYFEKKKISLRAELVKIEMVKADKFIEDNLKYGNDL
ncbi:MAG TPA: hypothetical protein VJG90_06435 [Candidatus Nanoarchaeia archaeon]|nr:hypothetical protein [Candidatus Nanoarchaeia archaeon]